MSTLLALDPGTRSMGLAFFDARELITVMTYKGGSGDLWSRVSVMCAKIRSSRWSDVDELVTELPEIYPGSPVTNDLIPLAYLCGFIAGECKPITTKTVLPKSWKGQLPKAVCHHRIEGLLSPTERGVWAECDSDDARDAVGIGLWALGRFRR